MKKHIFITDSDFANTDTSFQYVMGFQPSLLAMILSESELQIFLDGRYFAKTKDIDIKNIQEKIGNKDLEVYFIEFQDLTESLVLEISHGEDLSFQENIAIKYVEDIKKKFPDNNIATDSSYFQKKREIKNQEEKNNIIEAIKIIDNVFLYIQSIINLGDIFETGFSSI